MHAMSSSHSNAYVSVFSLEVTFEKEAVKMMFIKEAVYVLYTESDMVAVIACSFVWCVRRCFYPDLIRPV